MKKENKSYSKAELMACIFSRELEDHSFGLVGAHSLIPMAACALAQELHAPNLTWVSGGSGFVNPSPPLVLSSSEFRSQADAILPINRLLRLQGRHLDFFFAGGLQFDPTGATNLVGTGNPAEQKYTFRGPGSAGVAFTGRSRRVFYYTTRHSVRVFRKKVDFRSSSPNSSLKISKSKNSVFSHMLVSPLAIFTFNPPNEPLKLTSIHPGHNYQEIQDRTEFKIETSPEESIPITSPPTGEEIEFLRKIDRKKLLQRL